MGVNESSSLKSLKNSTRLTLFLFNDYLIVARKCVEKTSKKKKQGIVDRKQVLNTHELVVGAPLSSLKINRPAKNEYFELALLDNATDLILPPEGLSQSIFRFTPRKAEKMEKFLSNFQTLQNQLATQSSPAEIHLLSEPDKEVYFHAFKDIQAYLDWPFKNKLALLYLDGVVLPDVSQLVSPTVAAFGVIQAKNGSFRSTLKNRSILYTSETYIEASKAFQEPSVFEKSFKKSILNCGSLLEIYPPFGPEHLTQQKAHLQSLANSFGDGFKSKLKSLTGFSKWKAGKNLDADILAQQLWNDSMSMLANEMEDMTIPEEDETNLSAEDLTPRSEDMFSKPIRRDSGKHTKSPLAVHALLSEDDPFNYTM